MSAPTPTVSVVIGVYNGARKIGLCLESLLAQDYPRDAFEIIVVENGSTDDTVQVVGKYPVRLYRNAVRGLAAARNLGLAHSRADIVVTTDDDCVADPRWLAELVKPYADRKVGGVGGRILAFPTAQDNLVERFSDEYAPLVNYSGGPNEFMPRLYGANASFRRCHLEQIGGFNPKMVTGEDVDVSWRVQLETGARLAYAPDAVIYHRHRTTVRGLLRLYRNYGFGEIVLDTMYAGNPGYPRGRRFQAWRILGQVAALGRYAASAMLWLLRRAVGRATRYQTGRPLLWMLIEGGNIRGKLDGLVATRGMTNARAALDQDSGKLIDRLYGAGTRKHKERGSIGEGLGE